MILMIEHSLQEGKPLFASGINLDASLEGQVEAMVAAGTKGDSDLVALQNQARCW